MTRVKNKMVKRNRGKNTKPHRSRTADSPLGGKRRKSKPNREKMQCKNLQVPFYKCMHPADINCRAPNWAV